MYECQLQDGNQLIQCNLRGKEQVEPQANKKDNEIRYVLIQTNPQEIKSTERPKQRITRPIDWFKPSADIYKISSLHCNSKFQSSDTAESLKNIV
ncbi:hypothetical protein JTB14_034973 [Gonioctena quinquepunctata]|nr:hypothetical protein JTB14_034973 [Gonioctena quinquepunctata]